MLSMTSAVVKGYLYDPLDCVKPEVAGESIQKREFFSILLVFD